MEHLTLNPALCELFKQQMLTNQWIISHQDAGQTHLVGWGYEMTWQKSQALVTLRYFDRQGVADAFLEMSPEVFSEIQNLVTELSHF